MAFLTVEAKLWTRVNFWKAFTPNSLNITWKMMKAWMVVGSGKTQNAWHYKEIALSLLTLSLTRGSILTL